MISKVSSYVDAIAQYSFRLLSIVLPGLGILLGYIFFSQKLGWLSISLVDLLDPLYRLSAASGQYISVNQSVLILAIVCLTFIIILLPRLLAWLTPLRVELVWKLFGLNTLFLCTAYFITPASRTVAMFWLWPFLTIGLWILALWVADTIHTFLFSRTYFESGDYKHLQNIFYLDLVLILLAGSFVYTYAGSETSWFAVGTGVAFLCCLGFMLVREFMPLLLMEVSAETDAKLETSIDADIYKRKESENSTSINTFEQETAQRLRSEVRASHIYVLSNLTIPKPSEGNIQLDNLLLCNKGIFVIENKNYSGLITGGLNSKWYRDHDMEVKASSGINPAEQTRNQMYALKNHINNKVLESVSWIDCAVVFPNKASFELQDILTNQFDGNAVGVFNLDQFIKSVNKLKGKKSGICADPTQLKQLADLLKNT